VDRIRLWHFLTCSRASNTEQVAAASTPGTVNQHLGVCGGIAPFNSLH